MLAKRIIPCLDVKDGRTVKGTNFVGLRDAGDIVELAARYSAEGADELVLLDITASADRRSTMLAWVEQIARAIDIPFTVGGGISSPQDVEALLARGADKISINSSAVAHPELIDRLAGQFGSQCVVVAIDARCIDSQWTVYVKGGRERTCSTGPFKPNSGAQAKYFSPRWITTEPTTGSHARLRRAFRRCFPFRSSHRAEPVRCKRFTMPFRRVMPMPLWPPECSISGS